MRAVAVTQQRPRTPRLPFSSSLVVLVLGCSNALREFARWRSAQDCISASLERTFLP